MIKLHFTEPTDKQWTDWKDECDSEVLSLETSFNNGQSIKITSLYRQQSTRFHEVPFYGKCAYCESKVETTSPDYVEHFRPKAGVRDLANTVIKVTIAGQQIDHPGYYWLAYSWENLLPTCWKCNTWHEDSGIMIGKGNRFPISGSYAIKAGEEINEDPDLINPMNEEPSDFLEMDQLGLLRAKSNSRKGITTIAFFGLNTRTPLIEARKRTYDHMRKKIQFLFLTNDNSELAEVLTILGGKEEYTLAAKKAMADVLAEHDQINQKLNNP